MASKRQKQEEYYATESEWDGFLGGNSDSDNYLPSNESSWSSDLQDDAETSQQVVTDIWTDVIQTPPNLIFEEQASWKNGSTNINITIQHLVDEFFSDSFITLLVNQTNLYAKIEGVGTRKKYNRIATWIF